MMKQLIVWLKAARLHTMVLSVAVIIAGSTQVGFTLLRLDVLGLALLSAVGFQLISNFANDYGDFTKGTDTHRPEAYRSLSAGNLKLSQVKNAIILLTILSVIAVVALVWISPVSMTGKWVMFGLGILSVIAAMAYTLGKRPYGYYAMGDIMVFLFFGVVGVIGSYYLQGGDLRDGFIWAVAVTFGALTTSVLNINNMRDRQKDAENGKTTLANLLGDKAMIYQALLLLLALAGLSVYALLSQWGWVALLAGVFMSGVLWKKLQTAKQLDDFSAQHISYNRCLALTAMMTLVLSLPVSLVGLAGYFRCWC